MILVVTFFVSSSDSGSLVIDTLASGGAKEPPVWQRIYWAFLEGFVACALLLTGGLEALQTMTIASAFPMIILILIAAFAFLKSLREDHMLLTAVKDPMLEAPTLYPDGDWKKSLASIAKHPKESETKDFLKNTVKVGLEELSVELKKQNFDAIVEESMKGQEVFLVVTNKGVENFMYGVRMRKFKTPGYIPETTEEFYRAEIFLLHGGQDYDVYGFSKEQIISDAISHFKKHLHYLHVSNSEN